jgi:hypothetical protein
MSSTVRKSTSRLLFTGVKKRVWCVVRDDVLHYHFGEFQAPDISRDSVLGIATRLRDRRSGNRGKGRKLFSSVKPPDRLWVPPSFLFSRYRGCSPVLKRPGREVNHSPPSCAEDKNAWGCTIFPLYAFMAWTGKTSVFRRFKHHALKMID